MKSIALRLVLVLLAIAAIGAGGYYVFTLEARGAALREGQRTFEEAAARFQVSLADLRASQAAYLALQQDPATWMARSSRLSEQAETHLKALGAAAVGSEAADQLATAVESLATLGRFDARVRGLLQDNQPLSASSLVFADSLQISTAAGNAVAGARGAVARAVGRETARLRQLELYAVSGAGALNVLVLFLLVPARGSRRAEESAEADALAAGSGLHLSRMASPEVTLESLDLAPAVGRSESVRPQPVPTRGESPAPPAAQDGVDLLAAARLCGDLARIKDTSELQELLARAAAVLDATGIVVWMSGDQGQLWPAFSYGYGPQALSKMQTLPQDAGTAVSVAFRKGTLEVVPAENATSGAIVAPIVGASGCVGVMAVEIPPGIETNAAEQAVSGIIAAQLATLVAGETAA